MRSRLPFVFIAILFIACNRNNDPKPDTSGIFIKFFGNASFNAGFALAEAPDGFVLAGSGVDVGTSDLDVFVIKTDFNGNRLWEIRYGADGNDEARSVLVDASGNIHVVGKVEDANQNTDLLYLVLNASGNILKTEKLGNTTNDEQGLFISQTNDGGILLAGLRKYASDQKMYIAKFSSDSVLWDREVGSIGLNDAIGSIVQINTDSSLFWAGSADKGTETNIRLVKSDKEGNLLWSKEYGELNSTYEYCRRLILANNQLILVGSLGKENTGSEKMLFLKSDLNGNFSGATSINGAQSGAYDISATFDGGFAVLGYHTKSSIDSDFMLVKTDASGSPLWTKEFGGSRKDLGFALLEASDDNGLAMVGTSDLYADKNTSVTFIKCDKDGEMFETKK